MHWLLGWKQPENASVFQSSETYFCAENYQPPPSTLQVRQVTEVVECVLEERRKSVFEEQESAIDGERSDVDDEDVDGEN